MPYYDLKCADCEHEFNTKATLSDRTGGAIRCPACGSFRLETIFRKVNIIRSRSDMADSCPMGGGACGCSGGCAQGGCR